LCEKSCIGKTYAFTIRINDRYQYGNLLPGHQVDVVAKTGYPYEYEYFSNTAFNNMMSNSQGMNNTSSCDPSQSNTLCHYGLNYNTVASWLASPNGASGNNSTFIRHSGLPAGTFQDKNGGDINESTVWAVAKNFGKWRLEPVKVSNQLANDAATPCGQFGPSLTSMINYANNTIPLTQSLSCNGWAAGGGGVDPKPWDDMNFGGFVWSSNENNNDENAFDLIEEVGDIISDDFAGNNTGVPWWPSDSIRQIRIVNLGSNGANSACQGVIELYRDSLFVSETGELNYQSIALQPGLYSFLFINEDYQIDLSPLIMEKTNQSVSTTALSSYLTVESIFPNPIESGELTTRVSADASLTFDYKITSVNGVIFYTQNDISIAKDKGMKLIIPSVDLPSGSLIHTFIFEDGSTTSMTTIKQ
jgi:hypothetical protein